MKTKIEIIEETYEYYKTHPQALNKKGWCSYLTEEGYMCAIGRCMTNEVVAYQKIHMNTESGSCKNTLNNFLFSSGVSSHTNLDPMLKSEYRGHPFEFWSELQKFHDINVWTSGKINPSGQADYETLLERWAGREIIPN